MGQFKDITKLTKKEWKQREKEWLEQEKEWRELESIAYEKLTISNVLKDNINKIEECKDLEDKQRDELLEYFSTIKKINFFKTVDNGHVYIKIPNAKELYVKPKREEEGYDPSCTDKDCYCRFVPPKLKSDDSASIRVAKCLRPGIHSILCNCKYNDRQCETCFQVHPGNEHSNCKKSLIISLRIDDIKKMLKEYRDLYSYDTSFSYEDIKKLRYKIVRYLYNKIE